MADPVLTSPLTDDITGVGHIHRVGSECLTCTGKKRGGDKGGNHLHWRVQGSTSSPTMSVAGGGWFRVLWNLECAVGLSQKEICAHFSEGNLAQFGRSAKINSLHGCRFLYTTHADAARAPCD